MSALRKIALAARDVIIVAPSADAYRMDVSESDALIGGRGEWSGRRCLITGHTGFKGAWLGFMLAQFGAEVFGYSLPATPSQRPLFESLLAGHVTSLFGDIAAEERLEAAVVQTQPDVIFHLAAQPLVRMGYRNPIATYATNTLGTATVLDIAARTRCVRAVVVVTTDKIYANDDSAVRRDEQSTIGGRDPYSASKACAELIAASYRHVAFVNERTLGIATARAGNVIGGGDFGDERLLPDFVRAIADRSTLHLRMPHAVRPWQHVLDVVYGYTRLAAALLRDPDGYSRGWNFGPSDTQTVTARQLVEMLAGSMNVRVPISVDSADAPPLEHSFLQLDASAAYADLGWKTMLDISDAIDYTAKWYAGYVHGANLRSLSSEQLRSFLQTAGTPPPLRSLSEELPEYARR